MITFTVEGEPQGKGRARSFMRKSNGIAQLGAMPKIGPMPKIGHYTPKDTRAYEKLIRDTAWLAMRGHQMLDRNIFMQLDAFFSIPKSWSKTDRCLAEDGHLRPTGKPDWDNLGKVFSDAMNKLVYKDDAQIVHCQVAKLYGPVPMVRVTVIPL
jgi:Holliday junction resolvase RusA-like endonuclease